MLSVVVLLLHMEDVYCVYIQISTEVYNFACMFKTACLSFVFRNKIKQRCVLCCFDAWVMSLLRIHLMTARECMYVCVCNTSFKYVCGLVKKKHIHSHMNTYPPPCPCGTKWSD